MTLKKQIDECVILFARTPAYGQVKTRLAEHIGPDAALRLYTCFLQDMAEKITGAGLLLRICCHPAGTEPEMARLIGPDIDCFSQTGAGLGEKMAHAFAGAFASGIRKAVLAGSDLPDLPAHLLIEALHRLDLNDCVIGPAADGGYYLIGFTEETFAPEAFTGINWGTDAVYDQTREKLEAAGKKIHTLIQWRDIDDREDLEELIRRVDRPGADAPRTRRCLARCETIVFSKD